MKDDQPSVVDDGGRTGGEGLGGYPDGTLASVPLNHPAAKQIAGTQPANFPPEVL